MPRVRDSRPFAPSAPFALRGSRRQRVASLTIAFVWAGAMIFMLGWIIARTDWAIGMLAVAAILIHTGLWPIVKRWIP